MRAPERTFIAALLGVAVAFVVLALLLFGAEPSYNSDPRVFDVIGFVLLAGAAVSLGGAAWLRWGRGRLDVSSADQVAWLRSPLAAYVIAALLTVSAIALLTLAGLAWPLAAAPLVPAALYALKGWLSRRRPA